MNFLWIVINTFLPFFFMGHDVFSPAFKNGFIHICGSMTVYDKFGHCYNSNHGNVKVFTNTGSVTMCAWTLYCFAYVQQGIIIFKFIYM